MFGWLQFISSCLRHVPTCIAGVVRPLAVLKRNRKLWRSGISGPMPEPYNRCVLPGEKLSKVQLFYRLASGPTGPPLGLNCCKVALPWDCRFSHVQFFYSTKGHNPTITRIVFAFRNVRAARRAKREAISAFGARGLTPVMTWPNVKGFRVTINLNATYEVERRRRKPAAKKESGQSKSTGTRRSPSRRTKARKVSS